MEILGLFIAAFVCFFVANLFDSAADKLDGDVDNETTFEEMCQTANVITLTSWIGGAHATDDSGRRIRVPQGFPSLISTAARYGLYPTTSEDCMMTLVKKTA